MSAFQILNLNGKFKYPSIYQISKQDIVTIKPQWAVCPTLD